MVNATYCRNPLKYEEKLFLVYINILRRLLGSDALPIYNVFLCLAANGFNVEKNLIKVPPSSA